MRVAIIWVMMAACGFSPTEVTAPAIDAPSVIDSDAPPIDAPSVDPCAGSLLCFTFDQSPLPATLPNGGSAPVSATLTDVTQTQRANGEAAEMSSTSMIYVPSVPQLSGVLAYDYWIRVDQQPDLNTRYGIMDTALVPGFNSFYYNQTGVGTEIRCYINSGDLFAPVPPLTGWNHVACSCDAPNLSLYLNGVLVLSADEGCSGGMTTTGYGIQIGADNVDGPDFTDDILQGALDDVRLYNAPLTAAQVCKLAGTC